MCTCGGGLLGGQAFLLDEGGDVVVGNALNGVAVGAPIQAHIGRVIIRSSAVSAARVLKLGQVHRSVAVLLADTNGAGALAGSLAFHAARHERFDCKSPNTKQSHFE